MGKQAGGTEYQDVWQRLHGEVVLLHAQWQTFVALWGESDERVRLLNASAGLFFSIIQQTMLQYMYIGLSRLVDPTGQQQNLTIDLLLQDPRVLADDSLHRLTEAKIEAAKEAIKPIRTHRNKRLAHLDLRTALAGGNTLLPAVTRRMIEDALRALADVFNTIDQALNRNTTAFDHVFLASGDAEGLIHCLEQAQKWKEQERADRLKRRRARRL